MEEKRKHKRLDLDVTVELERLDKDGVTTLKFVHVDITDLSRSGIGFKASQSLEVGTYYDTKLTIWTKEKIKVFLDVVRRVEKENGINYGAHFVGMPDLYKRKIGIYQTVEEENQKQSE